MDELFSHPHRRYNPLLDEWVLVSAQRTQRPWQGLRESAVAPPALRHDPACYLCPGNVRAHGERNPGYAGTYVFDNDFPALVPCVITPEAEAAAAGDPLFRALPEAGVCRVVCYAPRHDLGFSDLEAGAAADVVSVWAAQYAELAARRDIASVVIFENRGAMMGASNPHPHGQIWASSQTPHLIAREQTSLAAYRRAHGGCLLCDCLARELRARERVVCENAAFAVLVPFWACWPFETLLLSKTHCGGLTELDATGRGQLAEILLRLSRGYDRLFQTPFPLSWGFHLPPAGIAEQSVSHLHAHFFPPLLRSATIRKFMVGYELLAMPQRDFTPEQAAERLRGVLA